MVSAKDLYSQRHRVEERWKKGPFLHKPLVHEDCSIVCLQFGEDNLLWCGASSGELYLRDLNKDGEIARKWATHKEGEYAHLLVHGRRLCGDMSQRRTQLCLAQVSTHEQLVCFTRLYHTHRDYPVRPV